ncbi:MAG: hypothetical protein NTX82_07090 [Candidatus Parcubacteria bacterium]|nr:hypothetical protein [Candidatus Parcubacteria bacterium]
MFVKIFGFILFAIGPWLILKTEWFVQNFGRNSWAEEHLSTSGGTRFFYKLLGLIMVFIGLTMMFDLFGGIVFWALGPLLPK